MNFAPAATTFSLRVLVIDDDPMFGRALARALSGHRVTVATHLDEALDLIASGAQFELTLCDVHLPGASGSQILRRLPSDRVDRLGRVVFMSAQRLDDEILDALFESDSGWIEKPIEHTDLETAVREAASREPPEMAAYGAA